MLALWICFSFGVVFAEGGGGGVRISENQMLKKSRLACNCKGKDYSGAKFFYAEPIWVSEVIQTRLVLSCKSLECMHLCVCVTSQTPPVWCVCMTSQTPPVTCVCDQSRHPLCDVCVWPVRHPLCDVCVWPVRHPLWHVCVTSQDTPCVISPTLSFKPTDTRFFYWQALYRHHGTQSSWKYFVQCTAYLGTKISTSPFTDVYICKLVSED